MQKSHVTIIATCQNADHNTPKDIVEAVKECNASDLTLSENGVIEATIPTSNIPVVQNMDGVCYVRSDMTYSTGE